MQIARSEHGLTVAPATELAVATALLECLPLPVLALDEEGHIRFANAQVVHLFRYAQAEFVGQPIEFLFPAAQRGGPTLRQWASGAEPVAAAASLPVQGMRKDGTWLHLHLRRGDVNAGAQPLTLCLIEEDRDIPAMQDLALTEARLNEAQRIAKIGSWTWNLINDTHWWSDELYRMLRLDRSIETRPYERFQALVNPEDRSRLDRTRERMFAGERVDPAEVRVTLADGTELIIETRGEATLDESGRPLIVSGTLQDVTQQKVTHTALRLTQTRYRDTQRMARIGNWEWDIATADSWWSEELYHILEEDPATYQPSFDNFLAHVHPEDRRSLEQRRKQTVVARNVHTESETRLLLPRSGVAKIVQLSVEVREDERGNPLAVVGTVHDITERRALETLLRESETRYASTVELAAVGIAHVAPAGHLIWSNSWLRDMLGYTQEELSRLTVWQISHPEDVHVTDIDRGRMHASELDSLRIEKRYLCKDGNTIWVKIAAAPRYDLSGKLLYDIAIVEDITPRKIAEERIRYLATHDELTGLPNRAAFAELLGDALEGAQRHDRKCAILFIDLDRFKIVNDSLGHAAGDKVLKEVAQRLRACVRSSDVVGRFGGDEFIVLLDPLADHAAAAAVAAGILSAMLRPVRILSYECRVTASIGIARFPEDAIDAATLMKQADMGMYLAKDEGKNNFQFYSGVVAPMSVERIVLETHLVHALERHELFLEYQPKIQLSTGRICGVEALLRWNNPQLGVLSPNAFVTLAEDTGLIVPIGKWVLRTACAQSMAWQRLGLPPLVIAVNLSPRQFKDPALVEVITAALQESGLPAHCLELEITETMIMNSVDQAAQTAAVIKSLGVRLAIDDFGTGYSSLSQLKQFPIDTLKIDRSFIRELPGNPDDQAITEAIISLGKALGVNIVAEGVETAAQELFLRERACDEVQGFLYSKPCDAEAFVRFFTQGNARISRQ